MTKFPRLQVMQVIHYAWMLYQKTVWSMVGVTVFAAVVSRALLYLIPENAFDPKHTQSISHSLLWVLLIFVGSAVMFWCHATLQIVAYQAHTQQKTNIMVAAHYALQKIFSVVSNGFMFSILLVLGLALYVLPGLLIAVFFMLYLPMILFENQSGFGPFIFSVRWVKPFFWEVLPISIIVLGLLIIPAMVIFLPLQDFNAIPSLAQDGMQIVLSAVLFPFANALVCALYLALKTYQQRPVFS